MKLRTSLKALRKAFAGRRIDVVFAAMLSLTLLLTAGCTDQNVTPEAGAVQQNDDSPTIVVTSYALEFLVAEMVGDAASVNLLPADAESDQLLSAEEIQQLQNADLILLSGAGYEPWLQMVSVPKSRTTDTSSTYRQRLLTSADTVTHQHGPRGADANDNLISQTWLAPEFAIAQARHTERRLTQLLPDNAEQIAARSAALVAELEAIQTTVQQLAESTDSVTVLATTSDYAYLVKSLDWKLELISDDSPELLPENSANNLWLVFVPQQAPAEFSAAIQNIKTGLVHIDSLETPTDGQSFTQRMQQNIDAIQAALKAVTNAAEAAGR